MKIKQYIVTYNNEKQINNCLNSIFTQLSDEELNILEVNVINNHSDLSINKEFLTKIKLLNNDLRPDFSTGHLSRSWNQAIINGFRDLKKPDCDILITNQDDTKFTKNYINKTLELHQTFDLLQFGWGDNFVSYNINAIKKIGLWDEKFCNIGYQEADYFTRALLFLSESACINDFTHKRSYNSLSDSTLYPIELIESGNSRGEIYNHTSQIYHPHSKFIYEMKWGVNPDDGWSDIELIKNLKPKLNSFILYPYFEKDIETLNEQAYIHKLY